MRGFLITKTLLKKQRRYDIIISLTLIYNKKGKEIMENENKNLQESAESSVTEKKSKLPLIIGGAVAGAVVIAAIIVAVVLMLGQCAHVDADDDGKCDKCSAAYEDGDEYTVPTAALTFTVKIDGGENVSGVKLTLTNRNGEQTLLQTTADGTVAATLPLGKYSIEYEALPELCVPDVFLINVEATTSAVTLTLKDNTPDGSAEKPFFLSELITQITLGAGEERYYSFMGAAKCDIKIAGNDITVKYDGQTYTAVAGVVTVPVVPTGEGNTAIGNSLKKLLVTNNSTNPLDATISIVYPLGSRDNPIQIGSNSTTATIRNAETVHYKWVADKTGTLLLTSTNDKNNIGMTNLSTSAVSSNTSGSLGEYIAVREGDEIILAVSSLDANNSQNIDINLAVYAGTEQDPVPVIKGKFDIFLSTYSPITFRAEAGKTVYIVDTDVAVKAGSISYTPGSFGMITAPLTSGSDFTVTNTSGEGKTVTIEIE